jgi:hypothetical protein
VVTLGLMENDEQGDACQQDADRREEVAVGEDRLNGPGGLAEGHGGLAGVLAVKPHANGSQGAVSIFVTVLSSFRYLKTLDSEESCGMRGAR